MDLSDKNNDYEDRYSSSIPSMDFSGEKKRDFFASDDDDFLHCRERKMLSKFYILIWKYHIFC